MDIKGAGGGGGGYKRAEVVEVEDEGCWGTEVGDMAENLAATT